METTISDMVTIASTIVTDQEYVESCYTGSKIFEFVLVSPACIMHGCWLANVLLSRARRRDHAVATARMPLRGIYAKLLCVRCLKSFGIPSSKHAVNANSVRIHSDCGAQALKGRAGCTKATLSTERTRQAFITLMVDYFTQAAEFALIPDESADTVARGSAPFGHRILTQ